MSDLNKYDYHKLTPFKWFVLQNFPFIEADFDAITNYQLFCKVVEYLNTLIASQNQLGQGVEDFTTEMIDAFSTFTTNTNITINDYINKFNQLKNFVDTYFENLDVQEEIDNKLDDMAEAGTLQEIITDYLKVKGLLAFDKVTDMINSTNLVEGSYAVTFGYTSLNDGGKSYYKIRLKTNEDTPDGSHLIALSNNTLVAELINPFEINPDNYNGANDTEKLQNAINYACNLIDNNIPAVITLNRIFNINNSLLINYNVNRIPLKFFSKGNGGININTETLFLTTKIYISDLFFENITFIGTSGSNNLMMTSPKFINVAFNNCTFKNVDRCINSESYIQAYKFLNCLITGGTGKFIECYGAYYLNIQNCTIEARSGSVIYQNSSSSVTYNRLYYVNIINNLIEGFVNENDIVFRFVRITKVNIEENYFESNERNILFDTYSAGGNLVINNNRCFFGSSVTQENNGLLYINPDFIHAFSIPKITMENNVIENAYLIYFKNTTYAIDTIYVGNSSLHLNNNRVSNSFTAVDFSMNGLTTNPIFNVLPIGKENNSINRNQFLYSSEKFSFQYTLEIDSITYTITAVIYNGVFYLRSSASFTMDNTVQAYNLYFGFDIYGDDIFTAQINISTGRIDNIIRGGTSPNKHVKVYAHKEGSSSDVTITANVSVIGTRG